MDIQDAKALEPEERLSFETGRKAHAIIVVSGYQECEVHGNKDEHHFNAAEVHLMVGPYLDGIMHVSPLVVIAGLNHPDSDTDDASGWMVDNCLWDSVSGLDGVPPNYERVMLKSVIEARGENARVRKLGYHVVIEARKLVDINQPGPAHY